MFKVVFTIFFIIHIVWWPIHFIFLEYGEGDVLAGIIFYPLGFYWTYIWLEKISNADPSDNWEDYWYFHGFGFLLSPVITIMTYAWIFLSF